MFFTAFISFPQPCPCPALSADQAPADTFRYSVECDSSPPWRNSQRNLTLSGKRKLERPTSPHGEAILNKVKRVSFTPVRLQNSPNFSRLHI